jgi:hypothetical protein
MLVVDISANYRKDVKLLRINHLAQVTMILQKKIYRQMGDMLSVRFITVQPENLMAFQGEER